jgi:O-antigen ligase
MYTGVLIAPIVIAYVHKPAARAIFAALIVIQLSLAALVVLAPGSPVGVLRGTQYHTSLGELSGVSQQFNGEVSRTGDQPRLFAQFSDPNTYGLYAVAGLALGFFLMMRPGPHSRRVAGIAIISLAVFGWITTFSRGATLGLLLGALLVVVGQAVSRRITTGGVLAVALVAIGAVAFAAIYASLVQRTAENLSVASINSKDVDSRLDAARVGWEGLARDPVFGVPLDFIWPDNIPPHQLPIYFAAQFGLPAGLLVCLLLWPIVGTTRRFLFSRISLTAQWDMALAVVVGWILLGTAASNNLSAPALFWVLWAIAAIPWLNEPRDSGSMRKDAIRFDLRGTRRLAMPVRRGAV